MVFSSLDFLFLFLPICIICYFIVKDNKWKNIILLVFSLLFYSLAEPVYIVLLMLSSLVGWYLSLRIEKYSDDLKKAKLFLVISIIVGLLPLCIFKYLGFIIDNLNLLSFINITKPTLTLPVGISFFSFQIIAYNIDVYKKKTSATNNYFHFLLFISMFPQLVQGPILRYPDVEQQIQNREHTKEKFISGFNRFIVGLAKKAILASELGKIVEYCFKNGVNDKPVWVIWIGVIVYSLQIYYDFSGYSDMALGLGKIFGFEFKENFNYPYVSRSASEFWRRWHISLGSFFKDYVYIPLGGNRKHQLFNLFVVWALTGLWHGASYNFILWGLYFFILLCIEKFVLKGKLEKIPVLSNIITLFLLVVGWAIFYFSDMAELTNALKIMFGLSKNAAWNEIYTTYFINNIVIIVLGVIGCIPIGKQLGKQMNVLRENHPDLWFIFSVIFDLLLLFISTAALVGSGYSAFLYFRF